ncbi:MAG: LysE family translocator [Acetobacteraceae bacterium]
MIASLASLVLFCFVMSATPGPNNMMVMASGARYGVRRTLPHMLGVAVGFPLMLVLTGAGFGALILASPVVHGTLESLAVGFVLWIAWRIATAGAPHEMTEKSGRPLNFFQAALFQWINPKAWAIAFVAVALYAEGHGTFWASLALIAAVFLLACLISLAGWAALGRGAGRLLRTERQFRLFNGAMAALLLIAMIPLAWGG